MHLIPLASSSSGNCILLSHNNTHILIDCGISGKALQLALDSVNMDGKSLQAILVTHEHSDHIKGLGIASRKYKIPIYANSKTWSQMGFSLGKLDPDHICFFQNETPFSIGDVEIFPFPIPHDAADPVGFNFFDGNGKKVTLATDIGHTSEELFHYIKGANDIVLESNHDITMLKNGRYHYRLKQRILGAFGHLSNDSAALLASQLIESGTTNIILAHLSGENNTPLVAEKTVENYLTQNGIKIGSDINLSVAPKYRVSSL